MHDTENTRWFKYYWDYLHVNKSQFVPVIFEPPCMKKREFLFCPRRLSEYFVKPLVALIKMVLILPSLSQYGCHEKRGTRETYRRLLRTFL
jgi:hypothetical protein